MNLKKGFVLPGVLLLIVILLLMAGTRHFFSQHQLNQAAHGAHYEKAYHMAVGALEAADSQLLQAVAFINDGRPDTFPKSDKAPAKLQPLLKAMLNKEGILTPQKKLVPIESELFSHLQQGLEDESTLKVELELRELETLVVSSGAPGPQPDEREKKILLMLHAQASVKGSVARVCRYRESRVVSVLPSILGKFALFLRRRGGANLNSLSDSNAGIAKLNDSPLQVFCGASCLPDSIKPEQAGAWFDRQGWIFMGTEAPWVLGAGAGGNNSAFASGMLDRSFRSFAIPDSDSLSSKGFLTYYSQPEYVFRELKEADYKEVMREVSADKLSSSRLRISGSAEVQTPTIVFGKVLARWVLIQGLYNSLANLHAPLPNLSVEQFSRNNWPGMSANAAQQIKDNFSGDYQRYKERMSSIIESSYNAGNLNFINFSDSAIADRIIIEPERLPEEQKLAPNSKIALVDSRSASLFSINHGNHFEFKRNETPIFKGNLSGFADLSYLLSKAGFHFLTAKAFYEAIKDEDDQYVIKNIYHVKGSLDINKPLKAEKGCGGMILVDNDITISESVKTTELEPLFIISLNGNIRLTTGQKIDAGLIALQGIVSIEAGAEMTGNLAAKELYMSSLRPLQKRHLRYNNSFDITNSKTYLRSFRFFMPKRGVTFVR